MWILWPKMKKIGQEVQHQYFDAKMDVFATQAPMVLNLKTQPKSWPTWANRYLEIIFSKFSGANPPPPPP